MKEENKEPYMASLNTKDFAKALELIEKSINQDPNNVDLIIEKSEILCEINHSARLSLSFLENYLETPIAKSMPSHKISQISLQISKLKQELSFDANAPLKSKQNVEKLFEWGEKNGLKLSSLKPIYFSPDNRALVAAHRIQKGETIIEIPEKLMLTVDKIYKLSPLAKKVLDSGIILKDTLETAMTCFVYETKKGLIKTDWQIYIDSLPEDFSTFPLFYNDSDKKLLEGTLLEKALQEIIADHKKEYNLICEKVHEFAEITFETFMKYNLLSESRSFIFSCNPLILGLLPIIDLSNYTDEVIHSTLWGYSLKNNVFKLIAAQNIKRGDEISLYYGSRPAGKYLQEYGFIPKQYYYGISHITPTLQKSDPLLKEKQRLLGFSENRLSLFTTWFTILPENYNFLNQDVFSQFRFVAYKGKSIDELEKYIPKNTEKKETSEISLPFLSVDNEIDALRLLQKDIMRKSMSVKNTYDKDIKFYTENLAKMSFNEKNAMIVRIVERESMIEIINWAEGMANWLKANKDEDDIEEKLCEIKATLNKKIAESFDPIPKLSCCDIDELE